MIPYKILDGAMGSQLIKKGLSLPVHTWSAEANIINPEMVQKIHMEYIDAGADYITANTFRTTPRAYEKAATGNKKKEDGNSEISARTSLYNAVELAKGAASNSTKVIGSIAPLEDCYSPNLFPGSDTAVIEFSQLGEWLITAGIDIFLLETMHSIEETEAGLISLQNYNHDIWVSFVLKNDNSLLSGDSLIDAINMVKKYPVKTILLNCNPLIRTLIAAQNLSDGWPYEWGVYPNLGIGEPSPDGQIIHYEDMDCFLSTMEKIIELGPSILGACCGSSPKHIQCLYNMQN